VNAIRILALPRLSKGLERLLAALSEIMPVTFEDERTQAPINDIAALILLDPSEAHLALARRTGKPCYIVDEKHATAYSVPVPADVHFGASPVLDARLRRRRLRHKALERPRVLRPQADDVVCASLGDAPVWLQRADSAVAHDVVAHELPEVPQGGSALDYLCGDHFLQVLPLVHFLRRVLGGRDWISPGLRACFMFDDPNLHWPSYGHIAYRALVDVGRQERFHVAMAMVPLDCWFEHPSALDLFRRHQSQLSLLFHGSHHQYAELARQGPADSGRSLMADAFARIDGFERRTGLRVDRCMAAPHGACSVEMMDVLLALGMEGACISPWSLRLWNPNHNWGAALGLSVAEMTGHGFPILPRFRLSSDTVGDAVVSGFLNRPIIAVGHHGSVADGLDVLAGLAREINGLGEVQWESLKDIQRSNYLTRRSGSTLIVRPGTSKMVVDLPQGVDAVEIEPPAQCSPSSFHFEMMEPPKVEPYTKTQLGSVPGPAHKRVVITAKRLGSEPATGHSPQMAPAIAVARRAFCELRDRAQPVVKQVRRWL
jgi:hypothetical protein